MKYSIRAVTFKSGERFVNLFAPDGSPMYWPTIWSLSAYRGRNRSVNTIESALRAIKALYEYLDESEIDLESRLHAGRLLSFGELEGLIQRLKTSNKSPLGSNKVVDISFSKSKAVNSNIIGSGLLSARLIYVREYLIFRCQEAILKLSNNHPSRPSLEGALKIASQFLKARAPKKATSLHEREGLSPERLRRLVEVVDHESSENPFKSEAIRFRNQSIIQCFIETGVRRGELLNIKIEDINFQAQTLKIIRRPNNSGDSRKFQPLVKTRGREIPISSNLCEKLRLYIFRFRGNGAYAKKHGYLFVSNRSGQPLSLKSLNAIFDKVRATVPELKNNIHPHILRHTWNDAFSEAMDRQHTPAELEEKLRAELMGWSPTSAMPSHYTKRRIREQAKNILRKQQDKALRVMDD